MRLMARVSGVVRVRLMATVSGMVQVRLMATVSGVMWVVDILLLQYTYSFHVCAFGKPHSSFQINFCTAYYFFTFKYHKRANN